MTDILSSESANGQHSHATAFGRVPLSRPFSSRGSPDTAEGALTYHSFPAPSNARPKTSHARFQPVEQPEPPRIPNAFNRTPAANSIERQGTSNWQPYKYSGVEPSRNLSSYSSVSSLRSHNSDGSPRKKRKRLLPFKTKFIGAWKEGVSKEAPNEASEDLDLSEVTEQLADLPADLKPAAARRLGVSLQDSKVPDPTPHAFVVRTGPSSVVHSRVPSRSDASSAASWRRNFKRVSRQMSNSSSISPINGQPRPQHPLEAEALHMGGQNGDQVHEQEAELITFYASSSDSEDDDKYSSGYSCGSSHTSYNMTSPLPAVHDGINSFSLSQNVAPRRDASIEPPPHQHQGSTSSFSSYQVSGNASPASRPASFSRPFPRLPLQQGITHSPPTSMISRDIEVESQPQLAAISEDVAFQPIEPLEDMTPLPRGAPKPPSHLRKLDSFTTKNIAKATSLDPKPVADEPRLAVDRGQVQFQVHNRAITSRHQNVPAADMKSARPLSLAVTKQSEALISADSAEAVILHIFETIDNFKDLFACARLNKGFYKVFKRHELRLMKNTLRNLSPAQWEHREASPKEIISSPEGLKSDYTPTSYVQFQKRDTFVLTALKSMILARCQAVLRFETVNTLAERDPARSTRVDDAFWRIWTFCTIFGSDKGRENDIDAQIDWLNGGTIAHQPLSPRNGTSVRRSESSAASTLASASFGRGNYGGLTVDELYDMTEIWNCIKALLRGIAGAGRCAQARTQGVFKGHDINEGDTKAEVALLEEWACYLATLGPTTIVDIATHSNSSTDEAFSTAKDMEWTTWRVPQRGASRSSFLEAAITRVHEGKASKAKQVSFEQMQEKRRSRGHELAAELREEKRRSVFTGDIFAQHYDQSIGVWLEWMAKVEGSKSALGEVPETKAQENLDRKEEKKQANDQSKRPVRQRRANSSLSLFPTTYTRPSPNGTPKMSPISTPRRSRNNSRSNSIVQHEETVQKFRQMATQEQRQLDRDRREQKQQLYTHRLSICQEA